MKEVAEQQQIARGGYIKTNQPAAGSACSQQRSEFCLFPVLLL